MATPQISQETVKLGTVSEKKQDYGKALTEFYSPYRIQNEQIKRQYAQQMAQLEEFTEWNAASANASPMRLGPNGQPLPRGASRWTTSGQPYYGEGMLGWAVKTYWGFRDIFEGEAAQQELFDNTMGQLEAQKKYLKEEGQATLASSGALTLEQIKSWWSSQEKNERNPAVIRFVSTFIGSAVDGWGRLLQEPARAVERTLTPYMLTGDEWYEQHAARNGINTSFKDWVDKQSFFGIRLANFLAKGVFGAIASFDEDSEEWKAKREEYRQAEIWRMGYSAAYNEMSKFDFMQRVEAGEDPVILAEELSHPTSELIGQIALDPLWYFDLWVKPKLTKARYARTNQARTFTPMEGMEDVAANMSRAASAGNLAAHTEATNKVVASIQKGVQTVRTSMVELGSKRGLRVWTAGAKRFITTRHAGVFLMSHFTTGKLDDLGDLVEGFAKLAGNADEVRDGLRLLEQFKINPNTLTSQTGLETAALMHGWLTKADGAWKSVDDLLKVVADAGSDVAQIQEKIQLGMADVAKRMFPNLQEWITQADKYAKMVPGSDEAIAFLKKFPQADKPISNATRALSKTSEVLNKFIYKPWAAVQGVVYMGLSPAYRLRNKIQNVAHIFVDHGVSAGIKSIFSPQKAEQYIQEVLNFIPDAAKLGIGPGGETVSVGGGLLNYFSRGAARDEAAAATHIFATSLRKSMGQAMQVGRVIPEPDEMLKLMSKEEQSVIINLSKKHHGNPSKIKQALAEMDEGFDVAKNLAFLTDAEIEALQDLRLYDDVVRGVSESVEFENAAAKLDDLNRNYRLEGRLASRESPIIDLEDADECTTAQVNELNEVEFKMARTNKDAARKMSDRVSRQIAADRYAIDAKYQALEAVEENARAHINYNSMVAGGTSLESAEAAQETIKSLTKPYQNAIKNATEDAITKADRIRAGSWELDDLSRAGEEIKPLWKRAQKLNKEMRGLPVDFDDFTPAEKAKSFRSHLWESWEKKRGMIYTTRRENVLKQLEQQGRALAEAAAEDAFGRLVDPMWETKYIERMRIPNQAHRRAKLMDKVTILGDGRGVVYFHQTKEGIRDLLEDGLEIFEVEWVPGMIEADGTRGWAAVETTTRPDGTLDLVMTADGRIKVKMAEDILKREPDEILQTVSHELMHGIESNMPDAYRLEYERLFGSPARASEFELSGVYTDIKGMIDDEGNILASDITEESKKILERYMDEADRIALGVYDDAERAGTATPESIAQGRQKVYDNIFTEKATGEVIPENAFAKEAGSYYYWRSQGKTTEEAIKLATGKSGDIEKHLEKTLKEMAEDVETWAATGGQSVSAKMKQIKSWRSPKPGQLEDMKNLGQSHAEWAYANMDDALREAFKRMGAETKEEQIALMELLIDEPTIQEMNIAKRDLLENFRLEDKLQRYISPVDEMALIDSKAKHGAYMMDVPVPGPDGMPTINGFMNNSSTKVKELLDKVKKGLKETWGTTRNTKYTAEQHAELNKFFDTMGSRANEAKLRAIDVATQARDFALHAYPKRYGFDLILSMIFPYHFWYTRTYASWMKRITDNPALVGAYFKYRRFLEQTHADLPEWWKYQLNSNELFGLDSKNPIWFNLESTLNPLYGLTGVDFTDSRRRVDWLSGALEDLGKYGPTTWTPFQLALATAYHMQGKDEAAGRWAGRMFTGTRTVRDVTAMMGVNEGMGWDPDLFVHLFSGGIDPYERARVGRQLTAIQQEGEYTNAEIVDAARLQSGPIWDEAVRRMVNERAMGNTFSWFAGTGFKPRNEHDIMVDKFYDDMYNLMAHKPYMDSQAYRDSWAQLESRYPFMDALLLSRKGGDERDEAFAWNVLGRIPPGGTSEMFKRVGLDREIVDKFYTDKGIENMTEAEKTKFMGCILQLGALLEVPTSPIKEEWDDARSEYRRMKDAQTQMFGDDIQELIDNFYSADNTFEYVKRFPVVQQAMDWEQQYVISSPILARYYTSFDKIEKYLKGKMYHEAEEKFGSDLWDYFTVYEELKGIDMADARRYWKDHPQLQAYMDFKGERLPEIEETMIYLKPLIPEGVPAAFREGMEPDEEFEASDKEAWIASELMKYAGTTIPREEQPEMGDPYLQQVLAMLPSEHQRLFMDYIYLGEELPAVVKRTLQSLGISEPEALWQ